MDAALKFTEFLFLSKEKKDAWAGSRYDNSEEWEKSVRLRIRNYSHPDLFRITPDKPENNPKTISVNNMRDNVMNTASIRPYEAPYKVYIIDGADKMNIEAQNALLKTLEEPPEYVVILLIAEKEEALLPTILSRVIEVRGHDKDVRERFRDFYKEEWAAEITEFISNVDHKSISEALAISNKMNGGEISAEDVLSFLEIFFRDVLYYKATSSTEILYGIELAENIVALSKILDYAILGKITELLSHGFRCLKANVNKDLIFENLLLTIMEGS